MSKNTPLVGLRTRRNVSTAMELAIRFTNWVASCKQPPSFRMVMHEFGVGRSTAYRWINAWYAANGQTAPWDRT